MVRSFAAAAAGAVLPLAFAPLSWSMLAIVALAIVLDGWRLATPGAAALQGFLFGCGSFGVGVSWLYISLHHFGDMNSAAAFLMVCLLVVFLSLFPAAVGYIWRRWFEDRARSLLWALPALWLMSEWLRARLLTGFPWLSVGYSQTVTVLGQLAPYVGVYGVGYAAVMVAAGLVIVVRAPARRTRLQALAACALLLAGAWALGRLSWIRPAGPSLEVALVQGNIPEEVKWTPGELNRIVDRYLQLMQGADTSARPALAIWPETAIPDYLSNLEPAVLPRLKRYVSEHHLRLLFGLVEDRGSAVYNSVALLEPGGAPARFYRKQHLVPFGEYLPLPWLLQPLLNYLHIPMSAFNVWHGAQRALPAGRTQLGVSICYEDAFSRHVRQTLPAATMLVNVSDDGWFGRSWARAQHLQMAQMRAAEAGRWLLSDTNNGITAAVGPHGALHGHLPSFRRGVLLVRVQPYQGRTPYVRYGETPALLLALAALVLGVRRHPVRS